jgi:hypothetical protein
MSTCRHAIIIGNDLSSDIDLPVDTSIDSQRVRHNSPYMFGPLSLVKRVCGWLTTVTEVEFINQVRSGDTRFSSILSSRLIIVALVNPIYDIFIAICDACPSLLGPLRFSHRYDSLPGTLPSFITQLFPL